MRVLFVSSSLSSLLLLGTLFAVEFKNSSTKICLEKKLKRVPSCRPASQPLPFLQRFVKVPTLPPLPRPAPSPFWRWNMPLESRLFRDCSYPHGQKRPACRSKFSRVTSHPQAFQPPHHSSLLQYTLYTTLLASSLDGIYLSMPIHTYSSHLQSPSAIFKHLAS